MGVRAARWGIERVYDGATVAGLSEGQLLDRFVRRGDPVAFEAIVARHGPMVLGVCRRFLRDPNDVDDAFQATFLVLVRKAGSLRRRELLGNWLYGVALRVAKRARAAASARPEPDGFEALVAPEAPEAMDPAVFEEVGHLPDKYRAPVVLCYLEGLTHDEAAA
ncbi:MAG: RNA polymerase subunit sigma-70, partial [Thermoleophilia bacterium]|nr:RNA polymerase subunit sigma-70 [Thermoleophilia bacterium]